MAKELFIVEGLSAASTLNPALDKATQAVLPLQGKLLNVQKASAKKVADSEVCQRLLNALGDFSDQESRWTQLFVLTDPNADGVHIRVLLIRFLERYAPEWIEAGLVSVIEPPRWRVGDYNDKAAKCAWTEEQYASIRAKAVDDVSITLFKSIAQLSVDECRRYLLEPKTRHCVRLEIAA